jgi:hypothetical protein
VPSATFDGLDPARRPASIDPSPRPDAEARQTDAEARRPDTGARRPDAGARRPDAGARRPDAEARRPDAKTRQTDAGARRVDAQARWVDDNAGRDDVEVPAAQEFTDRAQGIAGVLTGCRSAAALLAARADPADSAAYRQWLQSIAARVCEAARSGGLLGIGGELLSDAERQLLDDLGGALGLT